MKKLFLLFGLTAIIFASCSKSEEPKVIDDKLVFQFAAVNNLQDGFTRRLYSSEAIHEVSRVVVYAFKDNGSGSYLYNKTFDQITWPGVGESFYTYTVPEEQNLEAGAYKLLAVGREAADTYTLTTPDQNTNFNTFSASATNPNNPGAIFAGSADLTVGAEGGGRVSIQLTRQVAGLLGYFSNVPMDAIGGVVPEVLAVVITSAENNGFGNTSVNLTTGNGSVVYPNPITLIAVDLRNQQPAQDGSVPVFGGNSLPGVSKVNNSQLAGSYIIPTLNVQMEIVLSTVTGIQEGQILRRWPVQMAQGSATTFSLLANHLYTLGVKKSTTNTDGDNPINLNREESISISILPDWIEIHDLIIP